VNFEGISPFFCLEELFYLRAELVQIEGADLVDSQVATLILLPKNGNGLSDSWLQLFEIMKRVIPSCCKFLHFTLGIGRKLLGIRRSPITWSELFYTPEMSNIEAQERSENQNSKL
jgi:hypothetical protein